MPPIRAGKPPPPRAPTGGHRYADAMGRGLPSVTEVLADTGRGKDLSGADPAVLARAGERGTRIHEAVATLLHGDDWEAREYLEGGGDEGYLVAAERWTAEVGFVARHAELRLQGGRGRLRWAGTLDAAGMIRARSAAVVDFKTYRVSTRSRYERLQVAGYRLLCRQQEDPWLRACGAVGGVLVVELRPDGTYKQHRLDEDARALEAEFLMAVREWHDRYGQTTIGG